MRASCAIVVIALSTIVAGCATSPGVQTDPADPLESTNRAIFAANQNFDHAVLKPTAEVYVDVVPEPARDGVHNFLTNLNAPVVLANDLLQGQIDLAADTIGRFSLNSTLGLGGLIDLGTPAGIPSHTADFGQTLGVWGVGDGPYLVLPLLGPDNPRDLVGQIADVFGDPLGYGFIRDYTYWSIGREGATVLDTRARNIETLNDLENSSVDLYASERNLYRQYRKNLVHHGKADVKDLPDM